MIKAKMKTAANRTADNFASNRNFETTDPMRNTAGNTTVAGGD